MSPSARAGHPRREATRSQGKCKEFFGGSGPIIFPVLKNDGGNRNPKGITVRSRTTRTRERSPPGRGDFGRSGAGTGGRSTRGEKRWRTKALRFGPRKSGRQTNSNHILRIARNGSWRTTWRMHRKMRIDMVRDLDGMRAKSNRRDREASTIASGARSINDGRKGKRSILKAV